MNKGRSRFIDGEDGEGQLQFPAVFASVGAGVKGIADDSVGPLGLAIAMTHEPMP